MGMNANRLFVRDLVGVVTTIAIVTTLALWLIPHDGKPVILEAPPVAAPAGSPIALGARLYEAKGCIVCHTVDGSARVGPTFLHDYGTQIALADGRIVTMDDAYIRESVLHPQAAARPGYPPSMPAFDAVLGERDITALTAYIASLR
jgi:cytochrome c oxidase subunit II